MFTSSFSFGNANTKCADSFLMIMKDRASRLHTAVTRTIQASTNNLDHLVQPWLPDVMRCELGESYMAMDEWSVVQFSFGTQPVHTRGKQYFRSFYPCESSSHSTRYIAPNRVVLRSLSRPCSRDCEVALAKWSALCSEQ